MKKVLCVLLCVMILFALPACEKGDIDSLQNVDRIPPVEQQNSNSADIDKQIEIQRNTEKALEAYSNFLDGSSGFNNIEGKSISINDDLGIVYKYSFFDMNNDDIPELLISSSFATYILMYKDDNLSLWWSDEYWSGWSQILENGDILHIRPGGAPTHTSYHYLVLDDNGEEQENIIFEKYDSNEDGRYDFFVFEDEENLSEKEWDSLTYQYIFAEEIEWTSTACKLETVIADSLPTFTFIIKKTREQELLEQGLQYTYQINITCQEKPDLISQTFQFYSFIDGVSEYEISFVDIDFDGYLDIEIEVGRGNANRMFQYYRWDDFWGKYEETPFFEMIYVGYQAFPDTKQIIATTHSSATSYGRDMYQLIGGEYVWLRYEYVDIVKENDESYKWVLHINDMQGEIYSETLTVEEYYDISPKRDNYLRYGEEDSP